MELRVTKIAPEKAHQIKKFKAKKQPGNNLCAVYGKAKTAQNRWENATFTNVRLC